MKQNTQKIRTLLNLTEDQHNHMQFELGIAYLEQICTAEGIQKELSYSSLYWDWWRRQWQHIDDYFITSLGVTDIGHNQRFYNKMYNTYIQLHQRPHRINDRYMQDEIANDYNKMITEIIKNSLNKEVL